MLHTHGIVLRALRYGETSVIADIFTAEKGMCSFIGGSVRTAKSKMPFGLFQPMTSVELVSYWRDDASALHRLRELRAAEVWQAIPFELPRGAVALFLAEICRKCIQPGEPQEELFEHLLGTLRHLDRSADSVANVHLHFLVHLSGFLGFQPLEDLHEFGAEAFLDLKEGALAAVPPVAHAHFLNPVETSQFFDLLHSEVGASHLVALTRPERKALLHKLLGFYQLHVPGFTELNTPEVLELVLGN